MRFCIISPIKLLRTYSTLSSAHLALAHVASIEYRQFYRERSNVGDLVILDNGAYEGAKQSKTRYFQAAAEIRPQVMVAPDFLLQDWRKTAYQASCFLLEHAPDFPAVEWMVIPQGITSDTWWKCARFLMENAGEFIKWMGIPRACATHLGMKRERIAWHIRQLWPALKIHAMGMVNGDVQELNTLHPLIHTCDSSAPVWRGLHGLSISNEHDRETWDKTGREVDFHFNAEPDWGQHMIRKNLEEVGIQWQNKQT